MSSRGAAERGRRGHEPQRRCVVCGRAGAKRGMVRLVRTGEGRVQVDPTGKRSGRGAYICLGVGEGCEAGGARRRTAAEVSRRIERSLRVTLGAEDRRVLEQALVGG